MVCNMCSDRHFLFFNTIVCAVIDSSVEAENAEIAAHGVQDKFRVVSQNGVNYHDTQTVSEVFFSMI